MRIAINGAGRIGRRLIRLLLDHPDITLVAVNDIAPLPTIAHLLQYDSIHGTWQAAVSHDSGHLLINGRSVRYTQHAALEDLKWPDVDLVVESTGKFKLRSQLQHHIKAGAKRVLLSVPPTETDIPMLVLGINEDQIDLNDAILSCASCTTNNAAPLIKIVDELCGIEQAYITTVHSYTTDQSLHDSPHRDLRRARAAGLNTVPTTTGAAKALTHVFPHLAGSIGGCGIRVPVALGSLTDMSINVKCDISINAIHEAVHAFAKAQSHKIIEYSDLPLVSSDIIGSPYSCTYDSGMTSVIDRMVKLIGWYDNESGYASRLIDTMRIIWDLR